MKILNSTPVFKKEATPEIAGELLDCARAAKTACMAIEGARHEMDTERAVGELAREAGMLAEFDPARMLTDRNVALAFWINLYNTLVIHGALHFRIRRSITEIRGFFRRVAYLIGGHIYTLDIIEHGFLRENRGHPIRIFVPQLMPWDRRRRLVIRPMDTRVHFALNCGATSCPPIRHYTADKLDAELNLAVRAFLAGGGVAIDPQTGGVLLSRIFLWYARDFGWTRRRQLESILHYLDESTRRDFVSAAARGIRYLDYDWSLG